MVKTAFLHHSTTIKLLPPTIFIKGCYLSLRASLLCWDVIINLICAEARKFIQRCHADWYLQTKRLPITASAKQPHVPPQPRSLVIPNSTLVIIQFSKNTYRIRHLTRLWLVRVSRPLCHIHVCRLPVNPSSLV